MTAALAAEPPRQEPGQTRAAGVAFALAGATCWSLAGMLVRLTEDIDAWQIIVYRSLFTILVLGLWLLHIHGRNTIRAIIEAGPNALAAGLAIGMASITFLFALFHTTVAQAIFMAGVAPFVSALLAWWLLGERLRATTWIAMLIAVAGLAVMLAGTPEGNLYGSGLAFLSACCFSVYSVLLRRGQKTDMNVATLWNAAFLMACSLAVLTLGLSLREATGSAEFLIGWRNILLTLLMGAVQLSLGLYLYARASRSVPAAELTLLALLEPALAPVWVWLVVGEVPAGSTLLGGATIMAAIVFRVLAARR